MRFARRFISQSETAASRQPSAARARSGTGFANQATHASVPLLGTAGNQAAQRLLHSGLVQAKSSSGKSSASQSLAALTSFTATTPDNKLSAHGTGPTDTPKIPSTGNTTGKQANQTNATHSTTPDGVDLGPTDLKKAYCLKSGSFKVHTGAVTKQRFAQGAQIIEFEGLKSGQSDGKQCACECGVYRQWIGGTLEIIGANDMAAARTELTKKEPKKNPTDNEIARAAEPKAKKFTNIGSCGHPLTLKPSDLSEEATSCISKSNDPCLKKFGDQPGADNALAEGLYVNVQYDFKYEIWDACQGKSVETQSAHLSIEGSRDPRSVIWANSQSAPPQSHDAPSPAPSAPAPPASVPTKPVQRSASGSAALDGVPEIVKDALLAPGTPLDNTRSFFESRRVADAVVNGVSPSRNPKNVSRTSTAPTGATAPPIVEQTLRTEGNPLPETTRSSMEAHFGADFGKVRVHTDGVAAQSARAINALAYTVGHDVVFDRGQYTLSTPGGQRLLAHELAHVVQQTASTALGSASRLQREPAPPVAEVLTKKSPWDELPSGARDVLQHSFNTSDRSKCKEAKNPEWMWCGQTAPDSFNHLAPQRQAAFRSLYQTLLAEGLWDLVKRVTEVQFEKDRGISGTSTDNGKLMERLLSNTRLCADTRIGGALHKGEKTWRKVVANAEGLHIGVGAKNHFSAHLDDLAPVAGREKDGQCRYSYPDLLHHLSSDVLGLKNIDFFPRPAEDPKPGEVQPVIRFRIPGT